MCFSETLGGLTLRRPKLLQNEEFGGPDLYLQCSFIAWKSLFCNSDAPSSLLRTLESAPVDLYVIMLDGSASLISASCGLGRLGRNLRGPRISVTIFTTGKLGAKHTFR